MNNNKRNNNKRNNNKTRNNNNKTRNNNTKTRNNNNKTRKNNTKTRSNNTKTRNNNKTRNKKNNNSKNKTRNKKNNNSKNNSNKPMEVKMIPIKEWLEHYGLGEYANDLKLNNEIKLTKTDNIYIRTNLDLLDFFTSVDNFANYIEGIVMIKNAPKTDRKNDPELYEKIDKDIEQFMKAYKMLDAQRKDYTKYKFILGPDATQEDYEKFMTKDNLIFQTEYFSSFDEKQKKSRIYKDDPYTIEEILEKMRLLKLDELFDPDLDLDNYMIKDIELIKLANRYLRKNPEVKTIFTGCEPTMTNEEYKNFINNNTIFDMFVSSKNRNSVETMRETILENLPTAEKFLKVSKQNLFEMLVDSPRTPPRILLIRMKKILFPSRSQRVFNTLMKRIKEIPNRKNIDFNKNKLRIFIVAGHGAPCDIYFYRMVESKNRVDLSKVIKGSEEDPLPNADDLTVLATQPFGRLSHQTNTNHLINVLINEDREAIIRGLLNVQTTEELRLIENFINMWIYKTETGDEFDKTDFEQEYAEYLKTQKEFSRSKTTTPERINFVRYSSKYPPPNKEIYFEPTTNKEIALGVYEITTPYVSDLESIQKQINNYLSRDKEIKMGVHKNLYRIRGNRPKNYEEIIKINKELYEKSKKQSIMLSDVLESIYANSNIKKGEKVVVLTNQCRGVLLQPNYTNTLPPDQKAAFERGDIMFDRGHFLTGIEETLMNVIRKRSGQNINNQANQQKANQ